MAVSSIFGSFCSFYSIYHRKHRRLNGITSRRKCKIIGLCKTALKMFPTALFVAICKVSYHSIATAVLDWALIIAFTPSKLIRGYQSCSRRSSCVVAIVSKCPSSIGCHIAVGVKNVVPLVIFIYPSLSSFLCSPIASPAHRSIVVQLCGICIVGNLTAQQSSSCCACPWACRCSCSRNNYFRRLHYCLEKLAV